MTRTARAAGTLFFFMSIHTVANDKGVELSAADYAAAEKQDNAHLAALVKNAAVQPHWLDAGKRFWYTRDEDEGRSVVVVDVASGTRQTALVCGADQPVCRLEEEPMADPALLYAPGGDRAAFVRDHNLWVRNLDDGSEAALTTSGERFAAYATGSDQSNFGRQSPGPIAISRPSATHWSPNGQWIITQRLGERNVETYPFLESVPTDGGFRPRVKEARIVLLGDASGYETDHYIIHVDTGSQVQIQLPEGMDLDDPIPGNAPLGWSEDGQTAYLYASSVDAQIGMLLEVDMRTGESRVVLEEHAPGSRVYLGSFGTPPMVRILDDEFIWFSERSN